MGKKLEAIGTYLVTIQESGLSETQKGFPQWVFKFTVDQKFIEIPDELQHFGLAEPAYQDYTEYGYEDHAYLVLFGEKGELLNYEQAQKAIQWDGADFQTLAGGVGKQVLIRVEENEYQGKTSLRVNWVDAADASPTKQLRTLDADGVKSLNAKFLKKKPVAPAKPATAPKAAVAAAPTKTATTAPAKPKNSAPSAAAPSPASAAPTQTAQTSKPAAKKPPVPAAPAAAKTEYTLDSAWEYVNTVKGETSDDDLAGAWSTAMNEIGENKKIEDFASADFEKVVNIVVKDLALTV